MSPGPAKSFDPKLALERARDLFWRRGYAATGNLDAPGLPAVSFHLLVTFEDGVRSVDTGSFQELFRRFGMDRWIDGAQEVAR